MAIQAGDLHDDHPRNTGRDELCFDARRKDGFNDRRKQIGNEDNRNDIAPPGT
jgi:hypothetical protein